MRLRYAIRVTAGPAMTHAMTLSASRNPAAMSHGLGRAVRALAVSAMLAALAACGGGKQEPPPAPAPVAQDTVFDDMTGTMDKARGVQDTVDAQKRELDRQVQAAEGADQDQ